MFLSFAQRVCSVKGEDPLEKNTITHWAVKKHHKDTFLPNSRKAGSWNYKDWSVNAGGTLELLPKRHHDSISNRQNYSSLISSFSLYLSGWTPHVSFSWDEFEPITMLVDLFWCVLSMSAPLLIVCALKGTWYQSVMWLAHIEHGCHLSCSGPETSYA